MQAKIYKCHPDAIIPKAQTGEAVGFDLHAIEDFSFYQGQRAVVGTGLVVQPPPGYHTEIFLRSGMAFKFNIMLVNGVGLIDRDYAGPTDELKVMLYSAPLNIDSPRGGVGLAHGRKFEFKKGERIAQLVFRKTETFELVEVSEAPSVSRGGFGSTGS
jgi:dUTP pyrophosphatase